VRPSQTDRTDVHRPATMTSAVSASARFDIAETVVASAGLEPRGSAAMSARSFSQPVARREVDVMVMVFARQEVDKPVLGGEVTDVSSTA
jgi:hypothetical protein